MTTYIKISSVIVAMVLSAAFAASAAEEIRIGVFKGLDEKPQVEIKKEPASSQTQEGTVAGIVVYYTYSPSYRQYYYSMKMEKGKRYRMEELNSRAFFLTIDRPWRITVAGWDQLPSAKMGFSTGNAKPIKHGVKRTYRVPPKPVIVIPK